MVEAGQPLTKVEPKGSQKFEGLRWNPGLIPPFHQQEPSASSEQLLLPVLSWFDWQTL